MLSLELANSGVTVNAIAPGNISTPMIHNDMMYAMMRPDLESPTADDVEPVYATLHAQPVGWLDPFEITRVVLFPRRRRECPHEWHRGSCRPPE